MLVNKSLNYLKLAVRVLRLPLGFHQTHPAHYGSKTNKHRPFHQTVKSILNLSRLLVSSHHHCGTLVPS